MIEPRPHLKDVYRTPNNEPSRLFKQRLDRNERNQPFSEAFVKKIKERLSGELFQTYPELEEVYAKLAGWLGLNRDQIILSAGSDQAIKAVFETFIDPGQKILMHFPSYAMYEIYAKTFQAEIIRHEYDTNLKIDWDEYADKITSDVRMVVVENPNGFLGCTIPMSKLRNIIAKAQRYGTIALVDEAYFHFHKDTAVTWLNEFDNLIIARTFSKALGLAGLRAGYLVSQPRTINYLNSVRPVYEITSMTVMVLDELLNHPQEFESYIGETEKNRAWFCQQLDELGIPYGESKTNFLTIRLGEPRIHDELRMSLAKDDILIRRPFREEHLKEWVRISTAPIPIQKFLIEELKRIIASKTTKV